MGADLLLVRIKRVPVDGAHRRINDLDIDVLSRVSDYIGWESIDPDDIDEEKVTEVREHLHYCVDAVFGGEENRNVLHEIIGGEEYVTAGGTSWGDSPCDEFDYICALLETGAFV